MVSWQPALQSPRAGWAGRQSPDWCKTGEADGARTQDRQTGRGTGWRFVSLMMRTCWQTWRGRSLVTVISLIRLHWVALLRTNQQQDWPGRLAGRTEWDTEWDTCTTFPWVRRLILSGLTPLLLIWMSCSCRRIFIEPIPSGFAGRFLFKCYQSNAWLDCVPGPGYVLYYHKYVVAVVNYNVNCKLYF